MQSFQSYKKYSINSNSLFQSSLSFFRRREGPKKASGLASNLSRLDLIPTTRSKLLRQMGIGRSIRNDCLRHLPNFLEPLPNRTETGKGCKICRRGVSTHHGGHFADLSCEREIGGATKKKRWPLGSPPYCIKG